MTTLASNHTLAVCKTNFDLVHPSVHDRAVGGRSPKLRSSWQVFLDKHRSEGSMAQLAQRWRGCIERPAPSSHMSLGNLSFLQRDVFEPLGGQEGGCQTHMHILISG
jgi:hypothetical protein